MQSDYFCEDCDQCESCYEGLVACYSPDCNPTTFELPASLIACGSSTNATSPLSCQECAQEIRPYCTEACFISIDDNCKLCQSKSPNSKVKGTQGPVWPLLALEIPHLPEHAGDDSSLILKEHPWTLNAFLGTNAACNWPTVKCPVWK